MRYPLRAAQTVRAAQRAKAERALAEALRRQTAAAHGAREASERLAAFRREEARRSAPTPRTGAGLRRQQAWARRVAAREAALVEALREARTAERAAAAGARRAREALAAAAVDEKVIERHEERWTTRRDREVERAEQDELDDFFSRS